MKNFFKILRKNFKETWENSWKILSKFRKLFRNFTLFSVWLFKFSGEIMEEQETWQKNGEKRLNLVAGAFWGTSKKKKKKKGMK